MQQLQAANTVEDKSVPVFTGPIEQKCYIVFILLFGVRHTFPKPVHLNLKETGWAQAGDLLVPFAWFHFGAPLAEQLFSVNAEGHISCVPGNVDALRSTLTAASNVVITL